MQALSSRLARDNLSVGFAPKYTQDQRRAVARLMLDETRSGPEIMRMAQAGEIADLGPFNLSRTSCGVSRHGLRPEHA